MNVRFTNNFVGYENPMILCVAHENLMVALQYLFIGNEVSMIPSIEKLVHFTGLETPMICCGTHLGTLYVINCSCHSVQFRRVVIGQESFGCA